MIFVKGVLGGLAAVVVMWIATLVGLPFAVTGCSAFADGSIRYGAVPSYTFDITIIARRLPHKRAIHTEREAGVQRLWLVHFRRGRSSSSGD